MKKINTILIGGAAATVATIGTAIIAKIRKSKKANEANEGTTVNEVTPESTAEVTPESTEETSTEGDTSNTTSTNEEVLEALKILANHRDYLLSMYSSYLVESNTRFHASAHDDGTDALCEAVCDAIGVRDLYRIVSNKAVLRIIQKYEEQEEKIKNNDAPIDECLEEFERFFKREEFKFQYFVDNIY